MEYIPEIGERVRIRSFEDMVRDGDLISEIDYVNKAGRDKSRCFFNDQMSPRSGTEFIVACVNAEELPGRTYISDQKDNYYSTDRLGGWCYTSWMIEPVDTPETPSIENIDELF